MSCSIFAPFKRTSEQIAENGECRGLSFRSRPGTPAEVVVLTTNSAAG
jgi:hypothetical protein